MPQWESTGGGQGWKQQSITIMKQDFKEGCSEVDLGKLKVSSYFFFEIKIKRKQQKIFKVKRKEIKCTIICTVIYYSMM